MRIFVNQKLVNKTSILSDSPGVLSLQDLWTKEDIYEKSAIDLSLFSDLSFGSITLVFGPRQIGKTASLRLYLSRVEDSETIIFTDCSAVTDKADLYEHLDQLIKGKTTIVLDEVHAVPDWHLALRSLHSEGRLAKVRVICTGSEARYLMESGERLPGRKGEGKTIFARPWSFREYVDFFYHEEAKSLSSLKWKHLNQKWLEDKSPSLNEAWGEYYQCGGFPRAVGEFRKYGEVRDETFHIYIDWILGIWSKVRTPQRSLEALSGRLIETMNSRVSHETLKKKTDIQSANTVRNLIEMLEDHLAVSVVPRYDPQEKTFTPAKLKKIYPIDPFIGRVFSAISRRSKRLIHQQMASDLSLDECAFFAQTYRSQDPLRVGYLYSDRSHSEVDFCIEGTGFELKSQGKPTTGQFQLLKNCGQAFYVTKEKLPLIAYLLGEGR